jgi:hypothetical protein
MEINKTFEISGGAAEANGLFLNMLFSGDVRMSVREGTVFTSEPSLSINPNYASYDCIQAIASANISGCTTQSIAKFDCAMKNVADAMTKTFRDAVSQSPDPSYGSPKTTGIAKTKMTYISVHWQWIALPVLVWLLGLTTLAGAIWKSQRAGIPTWKNDPMPLLFLYKDSQANHIACNLEAENNLNVRLYKIGDQIGLK